MIEVSVLIPAYNAEKTILNCLAALTRQTYNLRNFEVILVNDGSSDRTKELIDDFISNNTINIKLVNQYNGGPGSARNKAIDTAKGNKLLFTDSDCIPDKDWIKNIVYALDVKNYELVGGMVYCNDIIIYPWRISPAGQKKITANLALKQTALQGIRFGDDFNGVLCEDTDLVYRIEKQTNRNQFHYEPSARVLHPVNVINTQSVMKHAFARRYEVLLVRKYGSKAYASMHAMYQPLIVERLSIFSISSIATIALILAGLLSGLYAYVLLLLFTIAGCFVLGGYKFLVKYPKGHHHVSITDRIKTLYYFVVYNITFLIARIVGSITYKRIVI